MGLFFPTALPNTTVGSTHSNASDVERGPTTPSETECKHKPVHVTLSVAPRLNKDDHIDKDSLCEICLENVKDGQKILKTSCCRLLAHHRCLSRWAYSKHRGPFHEGISSFTCPKCRIRMDLAKFRRQLRYTTVLIDKVWALSSYDIGTTFTPLPQSYHNPWRRSPQGPRYLRPSDLLFNSADVEATSDVTARSASQPRSTDQIQTLEEGGYFGFGRSAPEASNRTILQAVNEPIVSQSEAEHLQQDSTGGEVSPTRRNEQRTQQVEQSRHMFEMETLATEQSRSLYLYQMYILRRETVQHQQRAREEEAQRRLSEILRHAVLQRRREAQRRWQEEENQRHDAECRQRQAERERSARQAERRGAGRRFQIAERIENVKQRDRMHDSSHCGTLLEDWVKHAQSGVWKARNHGLEVTRS
jgi:hypothetical protein